MKIIGGTFITLNLILTMGIIGGVERNTISISSGFWICALLIGISAVIFKGMEYFKKK